MGLRLFEYKKSYWCLHNVYSSLSKEDIANNAMITNMLSFITKWFRKEGKGETKPEEEVKPKDYEWGDRVPYSMDFSGADWLVVAVKDCARENIASVDQAIHDTEKIERIVELLEKLSGKGEQSLGVDPCTLRTLTAYKEQQPFAHVKFYDDQLLYDNGLFITNAQQSMALQAALYSQINF